MDDLCEISLKNICCACLSTERNLSQLCRIDDGVNNLFFLLSYKSEAYEAMFVKDMTQLFICWECKAIIQKLAKFREQVCIAQTKLTDIVDGKMNYSKIKCLSNLSYSHQNGYNQDFGIKVETPENFVDCGPDILNIKVETPIDSDEIPLAQYLKRDLANNNDEMNDNCDDDVMSDEDVMSDDDTSDSFPLKKLYNDKITVKTRDIPIIKYGNNEITKPTNMLEKLDCFDIKKLKNLKRKQKSSLAEISDAKEADHENILKSVNEKLKNIKRRQTSCLAEISEDKESNHENIVIKSVNEKTKSKRKVKNKNMEAYNVNIPISNGDKNKFNEIQKLDDENIDNFMIKSAQSEKNGVGSRDLEPVVSQVKAANDGIKECFKIIQMTETEMVKSIEMRKLENDYVNALNKCEACIQIFEDCDSLEKHISELHAPKPNHILCNICKVYVSDEDINTHKKVHYAKYVCRICKERLQYRVGCKKHLKDHLKTKHLMQESYIDQQMKILNELEDLLLYTKWPLEPKYGAKLKVLIDDPKGVGFACVECNKYFKNKNLRNKHIEKSHREGYQCPTCGKKFPFSDTLRRHEMIHCNPLPREQCGVCGKMVRADLVKSHARVVHSARTQYACAACDKTFKTRSCYEKHLKYARSHADRPPLKHKCSACGKDYRSPGELRDHYAYAHMGKTQHKCPICDKAYATRRCVTKHVRRAHQEVKEKARDRICQTCGRGFKCPKSLKEHELIHTGERPLSCDICARTFRQQACLYTHKRRVHKVALKKRPTHTDEIIVPNLEPNKNID